MNPQFAHYWQEGVILNEEEREHKKKITQAMNQGFVYTVPEGSPLNGHVSTALSERELQEMMLREHDTPLHLMPFFLGDENEDETDDELTQCLPEKETSEIEPAVFLTQTDYDAAISWVFSLTPLNIIRFCGSTYAKHKIQWVNDHTQICDRLDARKRN